MDKTKELKELLPSYFGPQLTGGAYSSSGLHYQDLCGLICLFEILNRNEEVKSLSVETINDFVIHQPHRVITAQVKKQTLTITDVKKILKQTYLLDNQVILIVASGFHENLDMLIKKRDFFRNALTSDLDKNLKNTIINDFQEELTKHGIDEIKDLFLQSEFRMIPEHMADLALLATFWKWTEKQNYSVDIYKFIDSMNSKMQILRGSRGFLKIEEMNELVSKHSVESLATKIIKVAYESQFIDASKILLAIGETQGEILKGLEDKLFNAQDMFKKGNYVEALDIYLGIVKIFPKEHIQIHCAMIYEILAEHENALYYCNEILNNNPSNYIANLIKGTCMGALKRYTEAIAQLEKTIFYKNTPEAHYNLGLTYWLDDNRSKAVQHFNFCLELDESFVDAHLNISICYFEIQSYELSLLHVNKALQLNPDLYQAYGHKGELYRFFGLNDDSIEYFQKCLEGDKENYQALLGISLCFADKGYLSESIIYFKSFFRYYYQNFFLPDDTSGKEVRLIDIGWKRTNFTTFELYSKNRVNIYINKVCLPISLKGSNDLIFIGSPPISDKTGTSLYPMIGKIYQNEVEYTESITQIREAVDLFQYFDKPLYVEFSEKIKINVIEREKYILIEMEFGEKYQIVGMTNDKSGGLEAFLDYFDQYGQYRIHLECPSIHEVFIIDAIKKIDVHLGS